MVGNKDFFFKNLFYINLSSQFYEELYLLSVPKNTIRFSYQPRFSYWWQLRFPDIETGEQWKGPLWGTDIFMDPFQLPRIWSESKHGCSQEQFGSYMQSKPPADLRNALLIAC